MRTPGTVLVRLVVLALLALATPGAAAAEVPLPAPHAGWDYQIGGPRVPASGAAVVVRDRRARMAGRYDVCYVNAFQTQPDERGFWRAREHLLLREGGRLVVDGAWGEVLLDISTGPKRRQLARIVGRWVRGCARAGAEAVELDNLDSWTRSRGRLTRSDALAYARLVNRAAHRAGLASAQKNAVELGPRGPRAGFDFAIAEACARWRECADYARHYPGRVFAVEYAAGSFRLGCRRWSHLVQFVLRDRDVTPAGPDRRC